tara:strand:- start:4 stop:309 length:306 start_codon:yes stop_codon:yes gene_type:complete
MNDTYLERIAIALEALVAQGTDVEVKPVVKEVKPVVKEVKPIAKTLTHDDLKQACLVKARADSANREKLKALLASFGAVKAVDVPIGKVAEVIGRINRWEF